MEVISEVEAGGEQDRADERHADGPAGNSVHSQKHDREHQGRAEISLPEEQRKRSTHADDDRNGLPGVRKVEPCGHVQAANSIASHCPKQFPLPGEVAGQE